MANFYKYNATMKDRTYFTSVISDSRGNTKRYFSNVESEIYFGDKEMDDLYQFEFAVNEKSLPIYGYNCYYASEIVNGQRLVQGQFVVNFTDSKYIQSVLSNIQDSVYNSIVDEKYFPGGDLHHAIYDKSFDIMIGYGYYDKKSMETYNATSQTILGAKITNMQKVLDTSGQPILEVFSFVAKDFIEENITETTTGNDGENLSNNNSNNNNIKYKFLCSDAYNANEVLQRNKIAEQNKCENIIHNVVYKDGYITIQVETGSGKEIQIKGNGSLELLDYLGNNVIVPKLDASLSTKTSMQIRLSDKVYTVFENKSKKENTFLRCIVKYKASIISNGKATNLDVIYENAKLYL